MIKETSLCVKEEKLLNSQQNITKEIDLLKNEIQNEFKVLDIFQVSQANIYNFRKTLKL